MEWTLRLVGTESDGQSQSFDVMQRGAGIRGMHATTPILVYGSDDADVVRASQRPHPVQDVDRHLDFSRPTGFYT
jgi:hypothetical protein